MITNFIISLWFCQPLNHTNIVFFLFFKVGSISNITLSSLDGGLAHHPQFNTSLLAN